MAITTIATVLEYNCDGATVVFPITFDYLSDNNIAVKHLDHTINEIELLPEDGSAYEIQNSEVRTTETYPIGDKIYILLNMEFTQETDLQEQGKISSDLLDMVHDKLTLMSQELKESVGASIHLEIPEPTANLTLPVAERRKDAFLVFDSYGNTTASKAIDSQLTTVSTAMSPVVEAPSLEEGRSELGISSAMDPVVTADTLEDGRSELGISSVMDPVVTADTLPDARSNMDVQQALPIGTILMFDGSSWQDNVTLPGWYACVAANSGVGCPDLENQFIKGSAAADVGDTGGESTHTLSKAEIPKHYHEIDHDHGAATTGSHSHRHYHRYGGGSSTAFTESTDSQIGWVSTLIENTSPSINLPNWAGNSEDGSETGLNGQAHNNEPQYYKLIYIRKCA